MKRINIIIVSILCLLSAVPCMGQGSSADREKAEKNTSPFSLKQFAKQEVSHYVLVISVVDRKIVLDDKAKIVEVPGKMPNQVGQFGINILSKNGEKIASRRMIDPMLIWTSEEEKNEVSYMDKGTIYIPLPKNKDIAQLEFVRKKEVFQKVDVSKLIERMVR